VWGFVEQVYFADLYADVQGRTLALLHNARGDRGVVLRWDKSLLPRFIVWKNTAAVEDGYVTGLEPATNFPNFKAFERERGRVIALAPHGRYRAYVRIEVLDQRDAVQAALQEIAQLQQAPPVIHRQPHPDWCQP
jgi:hypothetical protein